jgi:hypothetical protein
MEKDLYKTALLGTDRITPSVETCEKLRALGIETDDLTESVLLGIGILAMAERAAPVLVQFETKPKA